MKRGADQIILHFRHSIGGCAYRAPERKPARIDLKDMTCRCSH
ncbi:hypothetical protein OH687_22845 [Burkholderia anthina]|nr:hypothetical protein OH687_22845 [Burkholderia anthina]